MFFHVSIVLLGFGEGAGRRLSSAGRTFRFTFIFSMRKFGILRLFYVVNSWTERVNKIRAVFLVPRGNCGRESFHLETPDQHFPVETAWQETVEKDGQG